MDDLRSGRHRRSMASRAMRAIRALRWAVADTLSRQDPLPRDLFRDEVRLLPGPAETSEDAAYVAFEDVFYNHDAVVEKMRLYAEFLKDQFRADPNKPKVVDLGAGRGELLEHLRDAGFDVTGVEINDVQCAQLRGRGFQVASTDAISFLASNSKCLLVHHGFWLDVTHKRMYPAETVQFHLGVAGFSAARVVYRQPVGPPFRIPHTPEASYNDYAIIARR